MKIVRVIGGLGNQMFQFALYIALRKAFPNETIKLDLHGFKGYKLHNGFELSDIFPIDYQEANLHEIMHVAYPYPNFLTWRIGKRLLPSWKTMCYEKSNMQYDPTLLQQTGNRYIDGYWQNELYFYQAESEIRDAFIFPKLQDKNAETAYHIQATESMSIHVRRGDYINDPRFKGTCLPNYYQQAIECAESRIVPTLYCIFSNDIKWCKQQIAPMLKNKEIIYVDWNKQKESYIDMQLMSLCRHHIIANSSFSWWGAWLNNHAEKLVIGPKKWANTELFNSPMCHEWLSI